MSDDDGCTAMLAALVVGMIIGFTCFGYFKDWADLYDFRTDAVTQGHAEFFLDGNNKRQWRWLPKGDQP